MAVFRWVVALIFLFVMVAFGVKNMQQVTVDYYWGEISLPMFLLMAVLVLIGAFASALIGIVDQVRLHGRLRSQTRRVKDLEQEIASLRGQPGRIPERNKAEAGGVEE